VIGEIHQLDVNLGRANERLNLANIQLDRVRADIKLNRRELTIAKQNLRKSEQAIARRLVTLYTRGEMSAIEVILGARSLTEVLNRIETQDRVSSLDAQVIGEVRSYRTAVKQHGRQLKTQMKQVKHLIARRAAEQESLEAQLGQRQRLLGSLNGEIERLLAEQQARELRQAQAVRATYLEQQARQSQTAGGTTFGAAAATSEGATVVAPSAYGGAVGIAMQYLGTPYVWGGSSPGGFDCSGLVMYAYGKLGVSLPHSSYALWNVGTAVPRDQLQAGDLVFFEGLGHMGMYIGGGQFVHAPHTGDVVKVSSLSSGSYSYRYVGARRVT
jgi:cell wall-associated NlpC family hydrolase